MKSFASMALPDVLVDSLSRMDFQQPTPIQAEAIPIALSGRDVLGSAQTGTGKTAAFLIPLLAHLLKPEQRNASALVIAPTRELAQQVTQQAHKLIGRRTSMSTALLMGGDSMVKQLKQLKANPSLIVGTPGRLNDHLRQGTLKLSSCNFLVLDETDRMLDMGFSVQLKTILNKLNSERQTLLFSATLPNNTKQISDQYLRDPVRVKMAVDNKPVEKITQETMEIDHKDKYKILCEQLKQREGTVIVFMNSKFATERMAKQLGRDGFRSDAIHGDLRQSRRTRVIESFRNMKFRVLVATDVAARGLDIGHVAHVINFDLPQAPEDYIHRIGRTARAGSTGSALNFISSMDKRKWYDIQALINPGKMPKPDFARKKSSSRHGDRSRSMSASKGSRKSFASDRDDQSKFNSDRRFQRRSDDYGGNSQSKFNSDHRTHRRADASSHRSGDHNRPKRRSDYQPYSGNQSKFLKPSGANSVFTLDKASETIDGVRVNYQSRQGDHGQRSVGQKKSFTRQKEGNRWSSQQDGRRSSAKDVDGNKRQRWQGDQSFSRGQSDKKRGQFSKEGTKRISGAKSKPQKTFKRAKQPSVAEA
tara:strand:- start:681 stop:2450 length:1770 start_codon:yes stop_codon:yes gene_type:complete